MAESDLGYADSLRKLTPGTVTSTAERTGIRTSHRTRHGHTRDPSGVGRGLRRNRDAHGIRRRRLDGLASRRGQLRGSGVNRGRTWNWPVDGAGDAQHFLVGFVVPPDAYTRFMRPVRRASCGVVRGVFRRRRGRQGARRGMRTGGADGAQLLSLGAQVAAIDPSPPFVDAIRARFPDIDARRGTAEELPYDTAAFDAALAQLVVHFMADPVVGIRQMARVTRRDGVIAACVGRSDRRAGTVLGGRSPHRP